MTARAEAQVMRLACIYALMDRSEVVRVAHLRAALAVWEYAEQSVHYVFGDRLGDPVADTILRALRNAPPGLSRTEISDLFGRHQRARKLEDALATLLERGLIRRSERTATGGRPSAWFHAI